MYLLLISPFVCIFKWNCGAHESPIAMQIYICMILFSTVVYVLLLLLLFFWYLYDANVKRSRWQLTIQNSKKKSSIQFRSMFMSKSIHCIQSHRRPALQPKLFITPNLSDCYGIDVPTLCLRLFVPQRTIIRIGRRRNSRPPSPREMHWHDKFCPVSIVSMMMVMMISPKTIE